MDPRIRQRRIAVARDEGRRRLRILLGAVGVVVAALAGVGTTRSPLLDVDYVDVRGAEQTPRRAVLRAGALTGHPAMVDVDTATVARRVESLPWVLEARARRDWPATVRVDVVERTPVAVVPAAGGGRWAVVDVHGRVLALGADKPPGLPVVGNLPEPGPPGSSLGRLARLPLRVAAVLPERLRPRVADLAVVPPGEVELALAPPGGVVRLGPPEELGAKLTALAAVLERADLTGVATIDVRVPDAPALTRR